MDQEQSPPQSIGIIANPEKKGARALVTILVDRFERLGIRVELDPAAHNLLDAGQGNQSATRATDVADLSRAVDMVVVLGGDGTMLDAANRLGPDPKPIAGINTGALGFLTTATSGDAERFVDALAAGNFFISRRSVIAATRVNSRSGQRTTLIGLNEAVISRGSVSRIIDLEARINGRFLNRFHADGLIVATPTGSTAYSLSAGGPIAAPDSGVFIITPICAHALANRPIVLSDSSRIEVWRDTRADEVLLTVDGQQMLDIAPDEHIEITRAAHEVPLVGLEEHSFYEILHRKLRWQGSAIWPPAC